MGADRGQAVATKAAAVPTGKPHRPSSPARHALACKTDSDCVVILSELIKDPKRAWIGQPQAGAEYADDTRFLAYRALRSRLSCRELKLASERYQNRGCALERARVGKAGSALAPASAVGAELMRELTTRCKASATQTFGAKALRFKVQLAEALP